MTAALTPRDAISILYAALDLCNGHLNTLRLPEVPSNLIHVVDKLLVHPRLSHAMVGATKAQLDEYEAVMERLAEFLNDAPGAGKLRWMRARLEKERRAKMDAGIVPAANPVGLPHLPDLRKRRGGDHPLFDLMAS